MMEREWGKGAEGYTQISNYNNETQNLSQKDKELLSAMEKGN